MILTIDQIKNVVTAYFKDKPVTKVYLFGSYARGEATENSDLDLLINVDESKERFSYYKLAGFLNDLQDLLKVKVDLTEDRLLYPRVKKYVYEDRKLLMTL